MERKRMVKWIFGLLLVCIIVLGCGSGKRVEAADFTVDDIGRYDSEYSVRGVRINCEGELFGYAYDIWKKNGTQWEYVSSNVDGTCGVFGMRLYNGSPIWLHDTSSSDHRFMLVFSNLVAKLGSLEDYSVLIQRSRGNQTSQNILETPYDAMDSYHSLYSLLEPVRNGNYDLQIGSYDGNSFSYTYNLYKILNIDQSGDIRVVPGNWTVQTSGKAYYDGNQYVIHSLPEVTTAIEGYQCTFDGWYSSASGGKKYETGDGIQRGTILYPRWTRTPLRYPVQCIDILGNNPSGHPLGESSWLQEYDSVVSGSQAGCIPIESMYYNGMIYTGCSQTTVQTSGNIVYRYFDYAEYPVQIIDQIVSGPNAGKNLLTTSRQARYKTVISGSVLGTNASAGAYYPGYRYQQSTSDTVGVSGTAVYRYFVPIQYDIVFDGNGADSGNMATLTDCWYDQEYKLASNAFQKTIQLTFDLQAEDAVCDTREKTIPLVWAGWADTGTGGVRFSDGATVQNLCTAPGETTLYAIWKPAAVTLTMVPKRMGYTFAGWSETPDAATGNTEFQLTEDTRLYAIWKPDIVEYHVEYYQENTAGDFVLAAQYAHHNYTDSRISIEDIVPDYPGFYLDAGSSKLQGVVSGDGSLVLLAYYRRNTYQITFDGQGGSADQAIEQMVLQGIYEQEVQIPDITLERKGYQFAGWTADQHSSQVYCKPKESYRIPNHDQVLYAVWQPDSYEIQFAANVSELDTDPVQGEMHTITGYQDVSLVLPSCEWNRNGYRFAGWNTRADGTGLSYEEGQTVQNLYDIENRAVTLYAIWEPVKGVVQYHSNFPTASSATGNGTMAHTEYQYDNDWALELCHYTLQGYDFMGWNTKPDGSSQSFADGEQMYKKMPGSGIQNLYAVWMPRTDTRFLLCLKKPGLDQEYTRETMVLEGETDSLLSDAILAFYEKQGIQTGIRDFVNGFTVSQPEILQQNIITADGETMVTLTLERKRYSVRILQDASDEDSMCYALDEIYYEDSYSLPEDMEGIGPVERYMDAKGNVYLPGENIKVTNDCAFMIQHILTYHLGDTEREEYVSHQMPVSLRKPEEKGYAFEGWYWDKSSREFAGKDGAVLTFTENVDLYAKWSEKKITYRIKYILGDYPDVALIDGEVSRYQYGDSVILPTATQVVIPQGYEFVGWYEASDDSKTMVTAISQEEYGDKVYCLLLQKAKDDAVDPSGKADSGMKEPGKADSENGGTDLGNGDLGNGDSGNGDTEPGNEDSGNKDTDVEQQSSSTANTNTISGSDPKMPSVFSAKKQTAKKLPLTFIRKRVTYQQVKSTQKAVKVVAVHDKARKVKIPAYITWKGIRYKVVEIGKNAFLGCKKLSKVTIGKQVTVIGAKAFYGCNKLRSVIFQGKKLNKIQKKAFAKTHAKIRFTIPWKKHKKYIRLLKKSRYAKVSAHLQKKCDLY